MTDPHDVSIAVVADARSRPSRRRWRQFSLKSLLFLTFIVAVACAWLAARREEKRREWATVESLRKNGVYIAYDWQEEKLKEPYGPAWLRRLLGDNFFSTALKAGVRGPQQADSALEQLARITSIRSLMVSDAPQLTAGGFAHLAALKQLEDLSFHGRTIDDACLRYLVALPSVRSLLIQDSSVTDAGLQPIERWPLLRTLWVGTLERVSAARTGMGDGAVEHLAKLTKLRSLQLQNTQLTVAGLKRLQQLRPTTVILPSAGQLQAARAAKSAGGP